MDLLVESIVPGKWRSERMLFVMVLLICRTCFACRRQKLPEWPMVGGKGDDVALVPVHIQEELRAQKAITCNESIYQNAPTIPGHCPRTWDNIMCWPDAEPGTVAHQHCPNYIHGFNVTADATKQCMSNGMWATHPISNKTWTNFIPCIVPSDLIPVLPTPANYSEVIAEHMPHITIIYNIGYSISFISLILAVVIMLYFKKLHCPRNTIHINLFFSFIIRAGVSCLKDYIMVRGLGLPQDITIYPDGSTVFNTEGSHWECRLLYTVFNYALMSNYFWVFVEALYLHMLIFVSVFSERSSILPYMAIGWCGPLVFIIPWVAVRAKLENVLCWNTNPSIGYFWILKGPIALTIMVNFVFFLNVVRVLFTKLKASNTPEARKFRYRKLARSTLVLIPLFGVHYIIFLAMPDGVNDTTELVKLYFEMFFSSFQGFLVSLLFCFLNGEVQGEIRKKWERYQLRRTGGSGRSNRSSNHTNSTYFTRAGRTSMHSIHSTMESRTEIINNGVVAIGNGMGPTARERMYSRGSVPRTSPEKDEMDEVEADICKMEDDAYPLQTKQPSVVDDAQAGGDNTGEQLLKPLLLENGSHVQEESFANGKT